MDVTRLRRALARVRGIHAIRLLLDTHVAIWFFEDPALLANEAREALEDSVNPAYVSAASVWEWALKQALGRISTPAELDTGAIRAGFHELPVTWAHGRSAADLPLLHADPFDRMLVAQALAEDLVLLTRDRLITQYPVATMPA
ncbi:MAG: type II toxin-antitoxin system VapC family toxin [Actinomycetota bacterium]|nr:type II toxin-antitoxin system VapC family toxin [Actinomycetota bacterium]